MLKKVRVEDNGDTDLFAGSLVDMYEFEDKNKEAEEKGLRPATGKRVLLGITRLLLQQIVSYQQHHSKRLQEY